MRREGLFRPIGTRRWPLVVLGVIALMLLPMQGVGAADGIGASPGGGLADGQRSATGIWSSTSP
jgi:hypothetical protein